MKNSNSASRISIQDLFLDILIRIFLKLNVVELSVASMVCKSWNEICRNTLLWEKLNLSRLSSNVFNIPLLPVAWRGDLVLKKKKLFTCLKYAELIFIAERYHFLLTTVHNLYVMHDNIFLLFLSHFVHLLNFLEFILTE